MLLGVSVQTLVILACIVVGFLSILTGLVLMLALRRRAPAGSVTEISIGSYKLKTDVPAVVALAVGLLLMGFPLWKSYDELPILSVEGKMQFENGGGIPSLAVGVLPASHLVLTLADGTYGMTVLKDPKSPAYQALVRVPNTEPPQYVLGVVTFDAFGKGRFDQTFKRVSKNE